MYALTARVTFHTHTHIRNKQAVFACFDYGIPLNCVPSNIQIDWNKNYFKKKLQICHRFSHIYNTQKLWHFFKSVTILYVQWKCSFIFITVFYFNFTKVKYHLIIPVNKCANTCKMNTRSFYCSTSKHVSMPTDDTSMFFIICIVNRIVKLQPNFEVSVKVNHHPIPFDTYLEMNSVSYQIKVIRFTCYNFFLPELSSIKDRFDCYNLSPNCFTSVFFCFHAVLVILIGS